MKADLPVIGSSYSMDSSVLPNMRQNSCFAHTMQCTGLEGVLQDATSGSERGENTGAGESESNNTLVKRTFPSSRMRPAMHAPHHPSRRGHQCIMSRTGPDTVHPRTWSILLDRRWLRLACERRLDQSPRPWLCRPVSRHQRLRNSHASPLELTYGWCRWGEPWAFPLACTRSIPCLPSGSRPPAHTQRQQTQRAFISIALSFRDQLKACRPDLHHCEKPRALMPWWVDSANLGASPEPSSSMSRVIEGCGAGYRDTVHVHVP